MKIAAISDIHGNLPALQAVLADVERHAVDVVVNLGDILSGPLMVRESADFLMARPEIVTIAGNHERQLLAVRERPRERWNPRSSDGYAATQLEDGHTAWLRSLPPTHWLADDVLLVHGTPGSDLTYWLETVDMNGIRPATPDEIATRLRNGQNCEAATLVLCGHTHVARVVQCGLTLVVNPGSVGLQAYADDHGGWHRVEAGSPHARYAVLERGPHGWSVQQCCVAYDPAPMAALAERNGRPEWAYALATGRMPADDGTIRE